MPELGRFVEEDANKGRVVKPGSLNYYMHCLNNPLQYVDRNGREDVLVSYIMNKINNMNEYEVKTDWNDATKQLTYTVSSQSDLNNILTEFTLTSGADGVYIENGRVITDNSVLKEELKKLNLDDSKFSHTSEDLFGSTSDLELALGLKGDLLGNGTKYIVWEYGDDGLLRYRYYCQTDFDDNKLNNLLYSKHTFSDVLTKGEGKIDFDSECTRIVNANSIVGKLKPLNFTIDKEKPWIYTNFPEQLTSSDENFESFMNGLLCCNAVVVRDTAQFYYSLQNFSHMYEQKANEEKAVAYNIGLMAINETDTKVTINVTNEGHRKAEPGESWDVTYVNPWKEFFKGSKTPPIEVDAGEKRWLCDLKDIKRGRMASGNMRFNLDWGNSGIPDSGLLVKAFMYNPEYESTVFKNANTAKFLSDAISTGGVHSGVGEGYALMVNKTISAQELLNTMEQSTTENIFGNMGGVEKFMGIGYATNQDNWNIFKTDIIPIHVPNKNADGGEYKIIQYPANLANWCAQYITKATFINDTNDPQTFYGYLISLSWNTPIINYGGIVTGIEMNNMIDDKSEHNSENKGRIKTNLIEKRGEFKLNGADSFVAWNWIKVTVLPMTTVDVDYQYILGTNGSAGVLHYWSLKEL